MAALEAVGYDNVKETSQEAVVYPNPSTGDFTIQSEGMRQIEVFCMDGRLVRSINTESPVLQLNGLPNGTYLVKMTTNDGIIVSKVVKL